MNNLFICFWKNYFPASTSYIVSNTGYVTLPCENLAVTPLGMIRDSLLLACGTNPHSWGRVKYLYISAFFFFLFWKVSAKHLFSPPHAYGSRILSSFHKVHNESTWSLPASLLCSPWQTIPSSLILIIIFCDQEINCSSHERRKQPQCMNKTPRCQYHNTKKSSSWKQRQNCFKVKMVLNDTQGTWQRDFNLWFMEKNRIFFFTLTCVFL